MDVENIDRIPLVLFQVFLAGHLCPDEPAVFRVAGEINAVAVRDGERGSFRNTLSSDVVSEPIEAKTRHNDAAHAAIVAVERQRKLNDFPVGCQTCREFSDGECAGLQDVGKVAPRSDVDWPMVAVRVAEGPAIQVGDEKPDERRKSLLYRSQISIARLAVPRFYRG